MPKGGRNAANEPCSAHSPCPRTRYAGRACHPSAAAMARREIASRPDPFRGTFRIRLGQARARRCVGRPRIEPPCSSTRVSQPQLRTTDCAVGGACELFGLQAKAPLSSPCVDHRVWASGSRLQIMRAQRRSYSILDDDWTAFWACTEISPDVHSRASDCM